MTAESKLKYFKTLLSCNFFYTSEIYEYNHFDLLIKITKLVGWNFLFFIKWIGVFHFCTFTYLILIIITVITILSPLVVSFTYKKIKTFMFIVTVQTSFEGFSSSLFLPCLIVYYTSLFSPIFMFITHIIFTNILQYLLRPDLRLEDNKWFLLKSFISLRLSWSLVPSVT